MANIEHNTIVSANAHEPKHITDSAISDAGKILTPSGTVAGVSELRQLTFEEIDRSTVPHINLEVISNATVLSVTAAVDATLHTSTDFDPITLFTEDLTNAKVDFTFDNVTGQITCNTDGIYRGDLWASVSASTATTLIGIRYGINGNYFPAGVAPTIKVLAKASGDIHDMSGFGEVPLLAGQVLTIGIASDTTSDLTVHEAALVLRRVA